MTNGPEDESGKTMMFDPSQAEEFRRKMAEEVDALKRARTAPAPPPEPEDEGNAKTMMFSPGQLEAQLRTQQHAVPPPAPPVPRPVAPPPVASLPQDLPDDGSGAVTQMFSAADVAKQLDEVRRMRDQGISGLPPMPKPPMPPPRAPVPAPAAPVSPAPPAPPGPEASHTVAYAPDQVKELLAKTKSGADDDLGTAQTMMYSVEQSAQLREAMALMEEHKAAHHSDPLADAHELLRQAREADEAAAAGPANPFSQYAPAPDANPFAQAPGGYGIPQPPSTGGFTPSAGGFQPGGFQPGHVPQGFGQGFPPPGFQGGRPVMDEGDLDDLQPKKGKGLKIALIAAGIVGVVVLALLLLNGFDVIDIPILPKF
jgi:hypothetical protein